MALLRNTAPRRRYRSLSLDALEKRVVLDAALAPAALGESALVDWASQECFPAPEQADQVFAAEGEASPWRRHAFPQDVNGDGAATVRDVAIVLNFISLGRQLPAGDGEASAEPLVDVNGDWVVTPRDIREILLHLEAEPDIASQESEPLTEAEVEQLLNRAVAASASQDAIIAVVDRNGRILGVHVEQEVEDRFQGDQPGLVFAIDGAVAKARTAAFFAADGAALTSRTVRFISQSTITQREVQSNPNIEDMNSPERGPGFVAPIGVGGHFPPEVNFTPPVDLVNIEHQSRDSELHAGPDGIRGTADDFQLNSRFNADYNDNKWLYFPESYGVQSGLMPQAQARGIATLPGGIGLFRRTEGPRSPLRLVGGIGVFFPGPRGYADYEQGFVPASQSGRQQTEAERTNAPRVLEAEWIAYAAAGGVSDQPVGPLGGVPPVEGFVLPSGRIDLVGVTLEIYGPHPTRNNRQTGLQTLQDVGDRVGRGSPLDAEPQVVAPGNVNYLDGQVVADEWIVGPRNSTDGTLTEDQVRRIIEAGIEEANAVRAAIRLTPSSNDGAKLFLGGERTKMVFAVADTHGEVLGLYRMPDATVFSIDVAVAKARNTAYYADASALQPEDMLYTLGRTDSMGNPVPDIPAGVAFTNRTFRFLADARFPTGAEQVPPGPFSMLNDPGVNPRNAENLGPPLPASVYSGSAASVAAYDAFRPATNFRDQDDLDHQNGVVFFPGSSPLYVSNPGLRLAGGFGVSGDGVDQDDVVTVAGQRGFEPPPDMRADAFRIRDGVRLPYQKFFRNPLG